MTKNEIGSAPYGICPTYESEHFLLRLVSMKDAEALLACYAQPTGSVIANSFNCTYGYGSQTMEKMRNCICQWLESYQNRSFVRWSVVDKGTHMAIGTLELFHRQAADDFNDYGFLRLDLSREYEYTIIIRGILSLLLPNAFALFDCVSIATRVAPAAKERMVALRELGFRPTDEQAAGGDGARYDGFWTLERQKRDG